MIVAEKNIENTIRDIENHISQIDSRVLSLERAADSYMLSHGGDWPTEIYDQIQKLMDERDQLYLKKLDLGGI